MIVTFYQHKQRHRRYSVPVLGSEPAFSPASPFEHPPPPVLLPTSSGGGGIAVAPKSRSDWKKRKMAVLCGHLKRRHQQTHNPVKQADHHHYDSDSDSDFYYFYPHKVKDRAAAAG